MGSGEENQWQDRYSTVLSLICHITVSKSGRLLGASCTITGLSE